MIHIIEGRIGSGKTYWCVSYILHLFYLWDDRFFEWFPKKDIPTIITNIRGLVIGQIVDLNKLLDDAGSLENLFYVDPVTYELRNKIFQNAVIIIDEAQSPRYFPRTYKNPSVMLFFQLHRHFGSEVFLTTQDVKTLCPDLRELPEYHLRCVRQSLQLGGFFAYRKYYDEEPGATTRVKRDQKVFDCYKSAEKGIEHKRVPSALMRYVWFMAIGVCLFILGGFAIKNYFFSGHKKQASSVVLSKRHVPVVVEKREVVPVPAPLLNPVSLPSVVPVNPPVVVVKKVIPELDVDQIRQECDLIGSVETDTLIELFQCGGTVFTVRNSRILRVRKVVSTDRIRGRESKPSA